MTERCNLEEIYAALMASLSESKCSLYSARRTHFLPALPHYYNIVKGYGGIAPMFTNSPCPFPSPCPYLDDNFGISSAQSVDKRERGREMTVQNQAAGSSYAQNRAVFHVSATVFGQELHNAKRRKTASVSQKMRN